MTRGIEVQLIKMLLHNQLMCRHCFNKQHSLAIMTYLSARCKQVYSHPTCVFIYRVSCSTAELVNIQQWAFRVLVIHTANDPQNCCLPKMSGFGQLIRVRSQWICHFQLELAWPAVSAAFDKERFVVALTTYASPSWLRDWSQYPVPVTQVGGGMCLSSIRCSDDVLLTGWGDLKLSHALAPPVSPGDGCVVRDIEGERQSINRRLGDECHADCSAALCNTHAHTHCAL